MWGVTEAFGVGLFVCNVCVPSAAPWFNAMKEYVGHHRAALVQQHTAAISASEPQFS